MSIPPDPFTALLSHLAHEMRAPLSAAQGYGRMLASGRYGPLSDGQSRAVEATTRCCERLSDLADQLSLLGKIERGELDPAGGTTAVEPLLAALAAAHVPHADHPVTVEYVSGGDAPRDAVDAVVRGETALLRRSLAALLEGVVRGAPDESTVQLAMRRAPGGDARETGDARDTGSAGANVADASDAGMTARLIIVIAPTDRVEALWHVDPDTLDPLNDFEAGLGLGLAIARRVITAAGGAVGARRQQGALAVRLTLPLVS